MPNRQPPLPQIWLVTDARNDARLARVLARLPRGSGVIFRHYHLAPGPRHARYRQIARIARRYGHVLVLSGKPAEARRYKADGAYGPPRQLAPGYRGLKLVTVHDLREIGAAYRAGADAVLLSPVYPTRSHPGDATLGPVRFRLLAARARVPVIALGGMSQARAAALRWKNWAAIDGH